jgi:hypothetical protein
MWAVTIRRWFGRGAMSGGLTTARLLSAMLTRMMAPFFMLAICISSSNKKPPRALAAVGGSIHNSEKK